MGCKACVKFSMRKKVEWGDKLCVVGNHNTLGSWKLDKARELSWNEGDVWTGEIELPDNTDIEFKVVTVKGIGSPEWENGNNRTLNANGSAVTVDLSVSPDPTSSSTSDSNGAANETTPTVLLQEENAQAVPFDRLPTSAWRGKSVMFMKENNHSKERTGTWDTRGLEGVLLDLVQGDEKGGRYGIQVRTLSLMAALGIPCCSAPP
jgi:hypothetical protein